MRKVYLPAGEWVDHWTGEVLAGGRYVTVSTPLDRIPLFVRHGALIPTLADPGDAIGDGSFGEIVLVGYGVGESRTTVSDLEGDTTITAVPDAGGLTVTVSGSARIAGVELVGAGVPVVITTI